jgi:hypothetical protein
MHDDNRTVDEAPTRRAMVRAAEAMASSKARELTPPDGSVAQSEDHTSVFCAQCLRWIDCYDGVSPEVARARHGELVH